MRKRILSLLAVRGMGSGIQLLIVVLLGNFYNAEMIGGYYVFVSWLYLFSIVFSLGLPIYLLKEITIQDSLRRTNISSQLFFTSIFVSLFISVLALAVYFLFDYFLNQDISFYKNTVLLSLSAATLLIPIKLFAETLKSKGFQNHGFFIEFVLPQFLVTLALLYFGFEKYEISITYIFYFYTGSYFLTILFVIFFFKKLLSLHSFSINIDTIKLKLLLPLWGTQIINYLFTALPYILFPLYYTLEEVGYFAVAHRLFGLSSTLILVLSSYYSPLFSRCYIKKSFKELHRLYSESRWLAFWIMLPLTFLIVTFPNFILGFFGGQLVNHVVVQILVTFFVIRQITLLFGLTENYLYMINKGYIELSISFISVIMTLALLVMIKNDYGIIISANLFIFFFATRIMFSYSYIKLRGLS